MNQNQDIQYTKHFINNQFVDSKNGKKYDTYNPTTGRVLTQIADGDQYDVNYAIDCAKRAYTKGSQWRTMDYTHRGMLLYKLADLMEHNADILANLETMDHGKPRQYVLDDVHYAIKTIRYYAGFADKMHGKTIPVDDHRFCFTRKEPYGVVGLILRSNNPIVMLCWKMAPALAAGNCLVIKPGKHTALSALYVAHLIKQAGFPDGVCNFVCGDGHNTGRAIVLHQDVRKIFFSGKTKNGKDVMENAARNYLKQVSLNLSSNNPLIIFNDYDVAEGARLAHEYLFRNQGQNSSACHRVYVHEDIYDDFVKRSVDYARNRKIGNPFEHGTQHGPQFNEDRMQYILNLIDTTKKEGAQLHFGGKRYGNQGYFIEPTVFSNCTDNMKCAHEELYGPVQYIFKFKNYDELYERINKNYFGYVAGVLTKNYDYAFNFIKDLEYGNVWINDYESMYPQVPYGGFKQSGWGYDLGYYGLYQYLQTKTVTFKTDFHHHHQF